MTPRKDTPKARPLPQDRQAAALDRLRAKGLGLAPHMVDGKVVSKRSGKQPAGTSPVRRSAAISPSDGSSPHPAQTEAVASAFPANGISFAVEGEPASKGRPRFRKQGGRTITYTPARTLEAERAVRDAFEAAAPGYGYAAESAYQVDAVFYLGTRRQKDVDNMLKLILDGLNGVAWADDHQVMKTTVEKVHAPGAARTVVTIRQVADSSCAA